LVCALSPSWTLAHELIYAVMDGPTVEQLRNAVREAEGGVLVGNKLHLSNYFP